VRGLQESGRGGKSGEKVANLGEKVGSAVRELKKRDLMVRKHL
jgi:hypothetical protein